MIQKLKQSRDISIGENLKRLRNEAQMTQEQVVAQLQLRNLPTSRSSYSQIESGTYNIRIGELIALVEIFHTDYNTIFNGLNDEE
ncbi:helix-turn-helix domain-containing protein [Clostridiales Family XIII bacterium ASD5510]|uniref:Helix-turn-helix domain-containing protein n=1 Tax=Hominibacterium faecale TaxID=2839743 RepID=A0A9J6QNR5_9FIRM|nr:helix-turn-helix transcriptional regulator [Hominibacterium faecale]MCU7377509.1 helix-turn-helix domain-containing protein [Hominibacterium faecale]